jgi:hypothetical protein
MACARLIAGVALSFKLDGDDLRRTDALDSPAGPMGPDPATATF